MGSLSRMPEKWPLSPIGSLGSGKSGCPGAPAGIYAPTAIHGGRFVGDGRISWSIVMLAAAMLSAPVAAQPVEPGEEGDLALLVKPEHGAHACFSRTYDAAHLAEHPKQQVTEMHFRLAYHRFEP